MRVTSLCLIFTFIALCTASACTSSHSYATTSTSGHFGCDSYGDRLQISWLIKPTDTTLRLILTFTAFDTEANYDFVRIYDGSNSDAPLLGSYSGSVIPGPFTSSTNALYIVFTADEYVEGGGFTATWTSFTVSEGVSPCTTSQNLELTGDEGEFGCNSYGNNINSSWRITGSPGERVVLSFDTFDTEVNYDIVRVYDGQNAQAELVGTFSGTDIPPPVTATGNVLYVTFTTDYSLTRSGFSASWTSLVDFADACYNSTTTILLPREGYIGCPYGYGNNVNSTWVINIIGNFIIQLNFLSLNTQENHDYVTVYDGITTSAPVLGRFSGTRTPDPIVSSGNRLLVSLSTDRSGVADGFTATYQSVHALQPGGCSRSGTFVLTDSQDSVGCNGYLGGVTEEWHLQAASEEEVINLTWHTFDTELNHDILYVYDGNTTTSPLVYQASGSTIPDPVVSSGEFLLVKFVADANGNQGTGFSGVFESVQGHSDDSYSCDVSHSYTLTQANGVFGCDGYGNNVEVSFQIHVETGFVILLDFNTFFTEALYDFVSIYDGPTDSAPALGSWSGAFRPPEISSSSNYLYVVLTSDGGVTRAGFTAEYTSVFTGSDADSCFQSGSHSLSGSDGTFGCTGYGSNVEISWSIATDAQTTISLDFASFQTEYNYDQVKIYDGTSTSAHLLATYSGYVIPEPVHSSSNHLYVTFSSDASVEYDGFRAEYHAVPATSALGYCSQNTHQTYTDSAGAFGCSGYANSIDSSWAITVAQGQRITLSITSISTELYYDYVKIYDGSSTSSTLLGTFSGNVPPPALTSTANTLYVTFHSDSSVSSDYEGFVINYVSFGSFEAPCDASHAYQINSPTGDFGCDGYSSSVTVSWLITSYGAIFVNFGQFDTEQNYDTVSIYDGSNASAPLLATYSGTNAPPVSSTGSTMFVQFHSDSSINRSGFTASFVTLIRQE